MECPRGLYLGRYCTVHYHFDVDDMQLYLSFKSAHVDQQLTIMCIETFTNEIKSWLMQNMLKLNCGKTKLHVLCAPHTSLQ